MDSAIATMPDAVRQKFSSYPQEIHARMLELRDLILACKGEQYIDAIEETLKWSEPSYLSRHGSTLRMDWKAKAPKKIGIYFNCQSSLVETIQEIYGDLFHYEGSRAILLEADQPFPTAQLQHCMILTLSYHKRKKLPLLGA